MKLIELRKAALHKDTSINLAFFDLIIISGLLGMKRSFAQPTKMALVSAASLLTEYIEFGPPGAQGGLCGLTLVQRVIRQLSIGDLQVVLADVQSPQHTIPGPGCRRHTPGLQLNRCRDCDSCACWSFCFSSTVSHACLFAGQKSLTSLEN